jgi:DNA mismatch repair protein MutH
MMKYTSKEAVHERATKIVHIKQKDLIQKMNLNIKGNKNAMGDVFEAWFGKPKDSASHPDLSVSELKATPFKHLKNGKISAKERLVLNIINYEKLDHELFENSHLIQKNKVLEIGFYEYQKNVPKDDWFFDSCITYEMLKDKTDLAIIKQDWQIIQSYIKEGRAEDLSEGLTNYLSACTKGKNSKSMRKQPHSNILAKQRAFSFKSSFMTTMLRNYVYGNQHSDAIIKDTAELNHHTLEEIIQDKFTPYIGKSVDEIINILGIKPTRNKNIGKYNVLITNKILGISGKKSIDADEFKKSSIVPKTIQFNAQNYNKESMSLPPFKFKDLTNEQWEDEDGNPDASLNLYLTESRFLFIVFQMDKNGQNYLKGIKFFQIPNQDKNIIKKAWQQTVHTIRTGVHLNYDAKRNRVTNNFVSAKDQMIIHVRPHANQSSYVDNNNSNELPTPAKWINKPAKFSNYFMTTQSFWINNTYIKEAVKELLS